MMKKLTLKELEITLPKIEVLEARTLFGGSGGYTDPPPYWDSTKEQDWETNYRQGPGNDPNQREPEEPSWWEEWDGSDPDRDDPREQDEHEQEDDRDRPEPASPNPESGTNDLGKSLINIDYSKLNTPGDISNMNNLTGGVSQTSTYSCVPASTAILLNYYGISVSESYIMDQVKNNSNITNTDSIYNQGNYVGKEGLFEDKGLILTSQTAVIEHYFDSTHYDTSKISAEVAIANVELQVTNGTPTFIGVLHANESNIANYSRLQSLEKDILRIQGQLDNGNYNPNNEDIMLEQLEKLKAEINNTPVSGHQYIAIGVVYAPDGETITQIEVINPTSPNSVEYLDVSLMGPISYYDAISGVNSEYLEQVERSNAAIERENSNNNSGGNIIGPIDR